MVRRPKEGEVGKKQMRFIRRHNQKNLIDPDYIIEQQPDKIMTKREDEIFEISQFMVFISTGSWEFTEDKDVSDIIESDNYISILDRDQRHVFCLRISEIEKYEFVIKKEHSKLSTKVKNEPKSKTVKPKRKKVKGKQ